MLKKITLLGLRTTHFYGFIEGSHFFGRRSLNEHMGHTVGINVSAIYYVRSSFFSTWIVIRCSRTNTPGSGYRTYRRYWLLPILRDTGISLGIALRPIFWDPGIVPRYRLRRILRDPGISLGIVGGRYSGEYRITYGCYSGIRIST